MNVPGSSFLIDTLVWTGVLIAFVLLVRRPTARWLGASAAYALWALPMARLLLPPVVLPAWMAPAAPAPEMTLPVDAATAMSFAAVDGAPLAAEPSVFDALAGFDWMPLLLAVWLAGAGVFLVRRYALYFQMRRELLAQARPVGEEGRMRLVETPAADGPVAFGVLDKVVALPVGFMASHDRSGRDLALAHELAHHRGHDLVCNMLVQPLFALHWFNPLAALGWQALRRDQEAACDARVMARQPREQRAAYAAVIARFATQAKCAPRLALAAPMACPVLGDRSIVQRLRSLAMTDVSMRRRWSGRLLIGAAVLALPLTGSISYAQDDVPPVPPAAPIAPVAPLAPVAPRAPTAPLAPLPPDAIGPDGKRVDGRQRVVVRRIERDGQPVRIERRVYRDGKLINEDISGELDHDMNAEERADFDRDMADHAKDMAEHAKDMAEMQREIAAEQAEIQHQLAVEQGQIQREIRLAVAEANRARPQVRVHCRDGQRQVAEHITNKDGETIFVCQAIAMAQARGAMATARAEIARSRDLSASERAEALRSLKEAERHLRDHSRAD